jgi:PAS domain-containing protein
VTSSPGLPDDIMALAHEELAYSEANYRRSRWLQVLTFPLTVAAIFATSSQYAYLFALGTLLVQVSSWDLRLFAGRLQAAGDEARMRGLLIDALGSNHEKLDLVDLRHRISTRARRKATGTVDPDYFACSLAPGLRRLCEHLQENAFWGKHLYKAAARRYSLIVWGFVAIATVVVLVAVPLAPRDGAPVVARIVVVALTLGAVLTQISDILSWRGAATRIESLDRRLESLVGYSDDELKSIGLESLFAIFGQYSIATSTVPPIPRRIYKSNRDLLNDLWKQR